MSRTPWREGLGVALLGLCLPACAHSLPEQIRAHRFPEACAAAESASRADRAAMERALLRRTHIVFRGRAEGRPEIERRLGLALFDDDVVLLQYDVVDGGHPCCAVEVTPRIEAGGVAWRPVTTLATTSAVGKIIAHPGSDRLWPGDVNNRVALLSPPAGTPDPPVAELVLTLRFSLADIDRDEGCPLEIERRFRLPAGASVGERLNLFLDAYGGEIVFGEGGR